MQQSQNHVEPLHDVAVSQPCETAPLPPATPATQGPFTDFAGLVTHLPAYGARTIRALVKRRVIPCVRLPGTRKLNFHLPSVEAALLRYQQGGPGA